MSTPIEAALQARTPAAPTAVAADASVPPAVPPPHPTESADRPSPADASASDSGRDARPPARSRTQYLQLRTGRYQFVRRYPSELINAGIFKRAALRTSLGTSDRLDAERLARRLAVRFDDAMARLTARAVARGKIRHPEVTALADDELRASDIDMLAARFEAMLLHSDDVDRGTQLSPEELCEYVSEVEAEQKSLRMLNACGGYLGHTDVVEGFLEAERLKWPSDEGLVSKLCKAMVQAQPPNGHPMRCPGPTAPGNRGE